jgi:hypothetical protein
MTEQTTQPEGQPQEGESSEGEGLLAGKYENVEALIEGYKQLESKLGGGGEKPAESAQDQAGEAATELFGQDQMTAWAEKVQSQGKLDPEDYQAIAAKGISAEMVDAYVRGFRAQAEDYTEAQLAQAAPYFALAGGQEQYNEMIAWAGQALDSSRVEEINGKIGSGDPAKIVEAIQEIKGLYDRSVSKPPSERLTGQPGTSGIKTFRSNREHLAARAEALRSKDPAKLADVDAAYELSLARGTMTYD